MNNSQDSQAYQEKKAFFDQLLTVYGRKPVLEVLENPSIPCFRLHLAESNKPAEIIKQITGLAASRGIETVYHDKQALSRISKNSKQDQGVCLDIQCPNHQSLGQFLQKKPAKTIRLLALDNITNPQNLGMIIRTACAGEVDGLLLAEKGSAKLDSLVIKASAGTLFKAPLIRCKQLSQGLKDLQKQGATVVGLAGEAQQPLQSFQESAFVVYVLGNETEGVSKAVLSQCDEKVFIPMNNQVESLNVAVVASLLAYRHLL